MAERTERQDQSLSAGILPRVSTPRTAKKDYSAHAPAYDQTRYLSRKARFTSERETALLRRALRTYAGERKLLVDVACGTGHFTHGVSDLFERVVGVDLTLPMLQRARQNDGHRPGKMLFVQGSADQLPVADQVGDVVMTTRFLHLFPRQQHRGILENLLRVLRPGGILVVEHDSPLLERISWLWGIVRGRRKKDWSSYHTAEAPQGTRKLVRLGVSAPGLPTLSLLWSGAARWLSRLFVRSPLNRLSTFVIVVYRKEA